MYPSQDSSRLPDQQLMYFIGSIKSRIVSQL